MRKSETVIFTDAAEKKKHFGAAVVILDRHNMIQSLWQTSISAKTHWSMYLAELITISYAVDMISNMQQINDNEAFTIISDSKSAL